MEQHQQHQPPLYQEGEVMKAVRPGPADSPPPNCAICLGTCTNKCFTDCCMHQFCFNCLLEWSKIKAECPLCKQPFKSIIYNIKSNVEYEEHIITNPEREVQGEDLLLDEDVHTEYLFLPNGPRPQRHFQFRFPRIPQQTIRFRRDVYQNNWWVEAPPDITGRYRECTPNFFRENPAQTHRIIPWLNRELTALLSDYTEIYGLQERIMEMLCQYPIQSTSFRTRLTTFFAGRTDHFIHEFYNFVRSPFDMIGYDRHISYSYARPTMVFSQSVSDDDSDVRVVDSPNDCVYVPPRTPEVIVINSDSESDDVIISTPPPAVPPTIVDLVDTDSDRDFVSIDTPQIIGGENDRPEESSSSRSPQLPIKIRLKLNRNNAEICKTLKHHKVKQNRQRYASDSESDRPKSESDYSTAHISPTDCTSSTMNPDDTDSSSSIGEEYKPLVLKVKLRGNRKRRNETKSYASRKVRTRKLSTEERSAKTKKKSKRAKQKKSKRKDSDGGCYKSKRFKRIKRERNSSSDSAQDSSSSSDSEHSRKRKVPSCNVKQELSQHTNDIAPDEPASRVHNGTELSHEEEEEAAEAEATTPETATEELDVAGPSTRTPSLRSVIVKGNNMWFCRPDLDATSDSNSD